MFCLRLVLSLLAITGLGACSPALNWREVRLSEPAATLMFPCKPETVSRHVPFDGASRPMTMLFCEADGLAFALTYARLDAAADMPGALHRWRQLTLANLSAGPVRSRPSPPSLAAATPEAAAVQGRRPDGTAVAAEFLWFASGPWVFQGSLLRPSAGPSPEEPAAAFWGGIRLP